MAVQNIELEELSAKAGEGGSLLQGNMELVKNVKVKLEVRVGDAELTLGELFDLKQGSSVQLKQDISAPVDILLDGRVVARGSLVAVGDNFGVRISEISPQG